ncbi:hypothetical protein GQX74_015385 [Glossina fuscipes]|nr:hypothetical protein GQX74_015385 [Glossina fuscipes]
MSEELSRRWRYPDPTRAESCAVWFALRISRSSRRPLTKLFSIKKQTAKQTILARKNGRRKYNKRRRYPCQTLLMSKFNLTSITGGENENIMQIHKDTFHPLKLLNVEHLMQKMGEATNILVTHKCHLSLERYRQKAAEHNWHTYCLRLISQTNLQDERSWAVLASALITVKNTNNLKSLSRRSPPTHRLIYK